MFLNHHIDELEEARDRLNRKHEMFLNVVSPSLIDFKTEA